jgi:hypothetical protein
LKEEHKYQYLISKLNEYNEKVTNNHPLDPYEAMYYARLHSVAGDLGLMDSKADQLACLDTIFKWAVEQETLITQRKDQGNIRYEVTK